MKMTKTENCESTIDIKDFQKVCRGCLQSEELKPFFNSTIVTTFKNITGIEIEEDDELPKNLCINCMKLLQDVSAFAETCKTSDAHLKAIAAERKVSLSDSDAANFPGFEEDDNALNEENILPELEGNDGATIKTEEVNTELDKTITLRNRRGKRITVRQHKEKRRLETGKRKRIEDCACNVCGKKFTRRGGLKRHSKIHLGIKPFECETCGKTFVEKATLNRHFLTHTGEKPFECNLCGKATTRKDQILEHISKHHPNAVNCDFVITEHKRTEIDANEALSKVKEELNQKCVKPDNERLNDNEQKANNSNYDSEIGENSNNEVHKFKTKKRIEICLCNLCGKVFRRRGYLKNHMAIHAKVKPFLCKICGKGFTQRHALTRHHLVHTKERPFQCNLCGKTFTRKEILMEHLKNHEEGMKPYLCYHCGKCFSNKDYLSKHLKYYMPGKSKKKETDKKCICPHCGKQLHSISYLKTHLLTHTGEKPFECKICGNRFTVQRSLNHHLNIHKGIKPYQCTQCEKAFRTSSSLRKHVLLHTGERPFKCTSCEKGFIRRSHLKRHLRTH